MHTEAELSSICAFLKQKKAAIAANKRMIFLTVDAAELCWNSLDVITMLNLCE